MWSSLINLSTECRAIHQSESAFVSFSFPKKIFSQSSDFCSLIFLIRRRFRAGVFKLPFEYPQIC